MSIEMKFCIWEKKTPNDVFLRQPFGDKWEDYTWKEAGQMARKLANGLKSLGLKPKDHVGIISANCREWVIADLAIMFADLVSVPLYPTLKANDVSKLVVQGDIKAMFMGKIDDWEGMKDGIPEDVPIIKFPHYKGRPQIDRGREWQSMIDPFDALEGEPSPDPNDIWTIIFTSGTTGTPKGVVQTYANLQATEVVNKENNVAKISYEGDNKFFSFLPLNHIAERMVVEHACFMYGGSIAFAESLETFAKNLQDIQPTLLFAVPRIWTRFQLGVLAKMPQKKLDFLLSVPILKNSVKKKIKFGLGLRDARGTITGAAAVPDALKDWYKKLDVPMAEGYGMTENCAITTILDPNDNKRGTVGKAQPGAEIKIDPETNEILMRAGYVMRGYYKAPEKTAETIVDGWLKTGDQGRLDENGYLYITGRVKDTFKTAKGQFIVPNKIEKLFESDENIEQLCTVGLGCPQPVMLVVLSELGKAKSQTEIQGILDNLLKDANQKLEGYQRVSTIVVVKEMWDVSNGLLTPTLKVKRPKINDRYGALVNGWHEEPESIVWEN